MIHVAVNSGAPNYFCSCGAWFWRPSSEVPERMVCPGCHEEHEVEPMPGRAA